MKKLFITGGGAIQFDPENQEAKLVTSKVQSIRSIYLIDDPTHIIYEDSNGKQEVYAEKDDLAIVFYRDDFPNRIVIAKAAQWVDNIKDYDGKEQKRLEEWAAKQKDANRCCKDCDQCDPTESIDR